ncbi:unnamed protein product [Vitrella brassicaformis CCMP3155]|uniref:Uncharacterized protein n=1 Tax=Vitrella brassicaformis (strain CCMP3155) TaxID=1169540 RepID=A0A0G4GZW2_VITBC|nr:unnamed protein product [Vitrella brassicaformis CCMP3155]|mmetsp:Transcript_6490/g.18726  ORF Transcript_6490/g.18726 Transcript_6490/m.18726 type:complete len:314 (-) Transcript_6490:1247-2188(-)|eukprot:CEM36641.1 unnamed protein product [Vitrella brassicaformis CCMP3155]
MLADLNPDITSAWMLLCDVRTIGRAMGTCTTLAASLLPIPQLMRRDFPSFSALCTHIAQQQQQQDGGNEDDVSAFPRTDRASITRLYKRFCATPAQRLARRDLTPMDEPTTRASSVYLLCDVSTDVGLLLSQWRRLDELTRDLSLFKVSFSGPAAVMTPRAAALLERGFAGLPSRSPHVCIRAVCPLTSTFAVLFRQPLLLHTPPDATLHEQQQERERGDGDSAACESEWRFEGSFEENPTFYSAWGLVRQVRADVRLVDGAGGGAGSGGGGGGVRVACDVSMVIEEAYQGNVLPMRSALQVFDSLLWNDLYQ